MYARYQEARWRCLRPSPPCFLRGTSRSLDEDTLLGSLTVTCSGSPRPLCAPPPLLGRGSRRPMAASSERNFELFSTSDCYFSVKVPVAGRPDDAKNIDRQNNDSVGQGERRRDGFSHDLHGESNDASTSTDNAGGEGVLWTGRSVGDQRHVVQEANRPGGSSAASLPARLCSTNRAGQPASSPLEYFLATWPDTTWLLLRTGTPWSFQTCQAPRDQFFVGPI